MDIKNTKIMFNKSGNGYINARVIIPIEWIKKLGITNEDRDLTIILQNSQIIIKKSNLQYENVTKGQSKMSEMLSKVLKEKIEELKDKRIKEFHETFKKADYTTIEGAKEIGYMLGIRETIDDLEELLDFIEFVE